MEIQVWARFAEKTFDREDDTMLFADASDLVIFTYNGRGEKDVK